MKNTRRREVYAFVFVGGYGGKKTERERRRIETQPTWQSCPWSDLATARWELKPEFQTTSPDPEEWQRLLPTLVAGPPRVGRSLPHPSPPNNAHNTFLYLYYYLV